MQYLSCYYDEKLNVKMKKNPSYILRNRLQEGSGMKRYRYNFIILARQLLGRTCLAMEHLIIVSIQSIVHGGGINDSDTKYALLLLLAL